MKRNRRLEEFLENPNQTKNNDSDDEISDSESFRQQNSNTFDYSDNEDLQVGSTNTSVGILGNNSEGDLGVISRNPSNEQNVSSSQNI